MTLISYLILKVNLKTIYLNLFRRLKESTLKSRQTMNSLTLRTVVRKGV